MIKMNPETGLSVAALYFLLKAVFGQTLSNNGFDFPVWLSLIAAVYFALLASQALTHGSKR